MLQVALCLLDNFGFFLIQLLVVLSIGNGEADGKDLFDRGSVLRCVVAFIDLLLWRFDDDGLHARLELCLHIVQKE